MEFKDVELMNSHRATPEGLLFNVQLDRPTKKYNRKVGTYHVGLRIFDKEIAQSIVDDMTRIQQRYQIDNDITEVSLLSLPYYDTSSMGLNNGYEFNPFRMNSCGWSGKLNNVYINIPKVFDIEGKELSHAKINEPDKEYWGRILYGIEPYNNQEGIGVVTKRLVVTEHTPRNKIAV